jgi:serine/threonine protein kinase
LLLAYGELLLREELGESPDPEEYLRRFPAHAAALRLQFELHRALDDNSTCDTGGDDAPAADGLPDVPGYELVEALGRGATSVVYRAWQRQPRRLVALKRARDDLRIGTAERARFRAEAEAVARLRHPNIVPVLDVGEHQGRPYLALEFVDGGSLKEHLHAGPAAPAEAARLVEVLAGAADHMHRAGIIHRDLNPANVLLQRQEESPQTGQTPPDCVSLRGETILPRITDFGLAKLLARGGGLTATGSVLGTPGYMAPEQADGRAKTATPAADVHALGAILYHLLTGRPPYDEAGLVLTILRTRSDEPPPAVRELRPDVPPPLEAVCHRCLSKRPGDRYPTARDLAADLERLASVLCPGPPLVYLVAAAGDQFCLSSPVTVLGRSADCDLRLKQRTASRHHCLIRREPDGAVVEDLGSMAGTRVNGRQIEKARLHDGDRLEVAGETFRVRLTPGGGSA